MRLRPGICASILWLGLMVPAGAENPPRVGPFGFEVRITFSAKAEARLRALREKIIVNADFSGDATEKGARHANEIGRIALGAELIRADAVPEAIHVTGRMVDQRRLRWVRGPVLLNVNVYSARLSGPDNILACDFFDGTVEGARLAPVELHCGLITENLPTKQKQ